MGNLIHNKSIINTILLVVILLCHTITSCKLNKTGVTCYVEKSQKDTSSIYTVVESMAQYKNGIKDVMSYILENFTYPNQETLQTKTDVGLIINRQGKIINPKILNKKQDQYSLFDKEMIRVLLSMPNWTPGKQGGEYINQQIYLPIQLEIK